MAIGFGIVTVAFIATFAKYFSKRWFIWFMGMVIAAEVAMFMNAGKQKKMGENTEMARAVKTAGSLKKDEISTPSGQDKRS